MTDIDDDETGNFVESMMKDVMSGRTQARERREQAARVLYDCEKRRATNAGTIMSAISTKAGKALEMEPWELCADTFLSDIDALVAAGFIDLAPARS